MGEQEVDPYHREPPYTFECPGCGHRLQADHQPEDCPECGGQLRDLSVPRD